MTGRQKDFNDGKPICKSFLCALSGLIWVASSQKNMKIHLVAAVLAFSAAAIFKISRLEIALIAIAVALVLIAELLNSAVEKTVDLVTCEYNPLAGLAKDAAAGAVLLAALFSAAVGILVFYPYIIKILRGVAEWITALR